jgi:plastocyanin
MKITPLLLLSLALVSCATYHENISLQGMPAGAPVERIAMTLTSYKITPGAISVKAGTHVVIELSSPESTHELVIEAFNIHVSVPQGEKATVEFFARTPGTYDYGCHLGLGLHYSLGMKGTLAVTPE